MLTVPRADSAGRIADTRKIRAFPQSLPRPARLAAIGPVVALATCMDRDHELDHTRHEYNLVDPDENRSYTEAETRTDDAGPREPGPPEEFGTATPHSRG